MCCCLILISGIGEDEPTNLKGAGPSTAAMANIVIPQDSDATFDSEGRDEDQHKGFLSPVPVEFVYD
jgi:hypothetical protein